MRILIFSETPEAKEMAEALRAEGHTASLRTGDASYFDPKQLEPADKVVAWDAAIAHAYAETGAEVEYLGPTVSDAPEAKPTKAKPKAAKAKKKTVARRT